jgi:twitching motility protein PilT
MARIDFYVGSLDRFSAAGMVLVSNGKVLLRFPSGDRHSAQTTPHSDLVSLVEEVCPAAVAAALRAGQRRSFAYELRGKSYNVTVEPKGANEWSVEIDPRAAGAPPSAPEPQGRADASTTSSFRAAPAPAPTPSAPAPSASVGTPRRAARAMPASARGVDRLLVQMCEMGASDLHLCTGNPPYVRHHGEMKTLPGHAAFTDDGLLELLLEIAPERNREEFERRNDTDFAHAIPGVSRFRANVFRDRRGPGAVFRAIPFQIHTAAELGLPPHVLDLCGLNKGLVLVTGPTGSGKSTTLAALIDHVNQTRSDHIITIEDPIEFIHENKKCLVNQREVHSHTESFKDALRAALREDPDIVLVGEMRDLETISIAVETAETGHLVFGTLHTTTAPSTIDRIIDQFPPDRQEQIRQMLSESLRGVIAQTLCKRKGGGRAAAYEILIASGAVSNLIRERKTFQLPSLMQTSRSQGMQTLNDSLIELVRRGIVEPREAYMKAVHKAELKTALAREGHKLDEAV